MKLKVKERFNDLLNIKLRDVGEEFEAPEYRALELIEKGYCEEVKEVPKEIKEEPIKVIEEKEETPTIKEEPKKPFKRRR